MYRVRRDRLRRQVERSIVHDEQPEMDAGRAALRQISARGIEFAAHNNGDR